MQKAPWIGALGVSYYVGVDGISLWLVILTTFLMPISVLASWHVTKRVREYMIFMLVLETGMIGVFVSLDMFLFYLFFEITLIPMYFLIGVWGGERRIYAAIKFFIYTVVGSLLMLVAIIAVYFYTQRRRHDRSTSSRSRSNVAAADGRSRKRRSSGSGWPSRSRSSSKSRSFRSTPGCRTRTSKRRPPARSFWPASC